MLSLLFYILFITLLNVNSEYFPFAVTTAKFDKMNFAPKKLVARS